MIFKFLTFTYIEQKLQKTLLKIFFWNLEPKDWIKKEKKRVLISFFQDGFKEMARPYKAYQANKNETKRGGF